jgi:hypothetical protein
MTLGWLEQMLDGQTYDPEAFVGLLQRFHESEPSQRGPLANTVSELIIRKRVDLAAVRQLLLDTGKPQVMDSLDRLLELIEPYIEEGGVEE